MIAIRANADGVFRVPAGGTIVALEATISGTIIWIKPRIRVRAGRRVIKRIEIGERPRHYQSLPLKWME